MSCANCEVLREQLAAAQRELGLRRRDGAVAAIMVRLGVSPNQSRLLLAMYESGGRVTANDHLLEATLIGGVPSLKTTICKINSMLDGEVIHNIYGVGYGLTPKGLSMVKAAVDPPEIQPVRDP